MTRGSLERLIRQAGDRRADDGERCELCAEQVPDAHPHVVDTAGESRPVLCVCRSCSVLFGRDPGDSPRYRPVPCRRVRLDPFPLDVPGVPVGLVFFIPRDDGTVCAHYPSPAGATRWEVDAAVWHRVAADRPELRTLVPEVEGLLVNTARGQRQYWIVPVDDCMRVVAVVRREWRGLSGGGRVWPAIEQFFAELTER
ncbi:DUF5947 family protein [Yinghuangia sp. ASG 101]|uniref:DUF5947 family protein n=1 Tax=Yinghuangia sp. ASG 101 TaxID=2896848 RepID=UPI001E5F4FEE|nr:DUF5947 family protein [Yinghuangia sp. ASG 101]UGQ11494.1 DUF5947 family protein [Yinghuangia sp. ASG 101]